MKEFTSYLSLGSNLGNSEDILHLSIKEINNTVAKVVSCSSIYKSRAMTIKEKDLAPQDDYFNLAVSIATHLEPLELLNKLTKIEKSFGRERTSEARWSSRLIDIDIVSYGDKILASEILTIPHPEYTKRDFVLLPLQEIAPSFKCPITKNDISTMISALTPNQKYIYRKITFQPYLVDNHSSNSNP